MRASSAVAGGLGAASWLAASLEVANMTEHDVEIPITLRQVIREDREFGIFLLEGGDLILFPA
jgi:hypothetical protein